MKVPETCLRDRQSSRTETREFWAEELSSAIDLQSHVRLPLHIVTLHIPRAAALVLLITPPTASRGCDDLCRDALKCRWRSSARASSRSSIPAPQQLVELERESGALRGGELLDGPMRVHAPCERQNSSGHVRPKHDSVRTTGAWSSWAAASCWRIVAE